MVKFKHTSIFILSFAFVVALVPISVYAQTVTEEPATELDTNAGPMTTEACNLAKQRISFHAGSISTVQADHSAKYATMKKRIDAILASATTAKYTDVSKLTAARDSVAATLTAYTDEAKVYATALKTTQSATCDDDTTKFAAALELAREELVTMRTSALAVKSSIKNYAVPAVREYASWLKTNTTSSQKES